MLKKIPLFYHPTAIIFVDDQELFIHSTLAIVDNLSDCRSFIDPKEALKYVQSTNPGAYITENFSNHKQENEILITQKELTKYLSSLERFLCETTLLIDYAMPKLNGLEFCENIENKAFKKIMLTGEAGPNIGIKALNRHLIDRFIYKNSPKVFEEVNQALLELRKEFFEEKYKDLLRRKLPGFLSSQAFGDFFMQIFHKFKGVEYYLINTLGDFLIIDAQGHATWVSVRDRDSQEFIKKFVEAAFEKKPSDDLSFAVEHLKSNDYLLIYGFGTFEKAFKDLILPATPINFERHQCYYATLPVKLNFKIKPLSLQKPIYTLHKEEV
jgi:DNA-binding NarL/FixJ family response regulator